MKRFTKLLVMLLVVSLLVVPLAGTVAAQPTQEEVGAAIDKGVDWLLKQQNDDGSWGNWEQVAVTAFAVKKLEHYAVDPKYGLGLKSPFKAPYVDQLQAGLNYLFRNAFKMDISAEPECDCDDDGIGVYFTREWSRTYSTGITLMAICETIELDRIVDEPDSEVDGWTYQEVAQDTLDYLCFGQNDLGWPRGGWGYNENDGWSDNSNTGYAVLGLQYAEAPACGGCGKTIKDFVKEKLEEWINYIQCTGPEPNQGGSGYWSPCDWVNILKTGNLLKELAFVGATAADPRVEAALAYLCRHWDDENQDPGWRGSEGGVANYQAMYTTMKGLTSLRIHEFCDIDWQADFETVLLEQQNDDGSWPRTNWDGGAKPILSTLWALHTLEKVVPCRVEGRMTGGGSVLGSRVTHGFELHCDATQGPNNLQVNWREGKGKINKFHLTDLTWASCSDDPDIEEAPPVAGFDTYVGRGIGRYNGVPGATIQFKFTDAGEPGKSDWAYVKITDVEGNLALEIEGYLKNGNHQAHAQ